MSGKSMSQRIKLSEPETLSQEDMAKFLAQAEINVPIEEKYQQEDLLYKHHDVFNKDKQDLGKAMNFEHKIDLKEDSLVYVKQFSIS